MGPMGWVALTVASILAEKYMSGYREAGTQRAQLGLAERQQGAQSKALATVMEMVRRRQAAQERTAIESRVDPFSSAMGMAMMQRTLQSAYGQNPLSMGPA